MFINPSLTISFKKPLVIASIVDIILCHVTIYRESRRHEQQIAVLQVTMEARDQFLREKRALKLTTTVVVVFVLAICRCSLLEHLGTLSKAGSLWMYCMLFVTLQLV